METLRFFLELKFIVHIKGNSTASLKLNVELGINSLGYLSPAHMGWAFFWLKYGNYITVKSFKNQVKSQVEDQVWNQVMDQVWGQVWDHVRGQVRYQVRDQVWDQVEYQVWNQVRDQGKNEII
jgi:hypothetical protein